MNSNSALFRWSLLGCMLIALCLIIGTSTSFASTVNLPGDRCWSTSPHCPDEIANYEYCPWNYPNYCPWDWSYEVVDSVGVSSSSMTLSTNVGTPAFGAYGTTGYFTAEEFGAYDDSYFRVWLSVYNYQTNTWGGWNLWKNGWDLGTFDWWDTLGNPTLFATYVDARANYINNWDAQSSVYYFAVADSVTSLYFNTTPASPVTAGQNVTLSAQGYGAPLGDYLYRFNVGTFTNGAWTGTQVLQNPSTSNTCNWTAPAYDASKAYMLYVEASTNSQAEAFGFGYDQIEFSPTYYVNPPALSINTGSLPNANQGVAYYSNALQPTGGVSPYTWSIWNGDAYWQFRTLPPGLSLNSSTGEISGIPTSTGSYDFMVQLKDSQNPQAVYQKPFYIAVYAPIVINTNSPFQTGTVGNSYSKTLSPSGGNGSYTWSLYSGSLPSGLSLSTSGVISGTPSGNGNSTFTVKLRDSQNPPATINKDFTITVYPQLQITTDNLPAGVVNVSYTQALSPTGGNGNYTWSLDSGNLPPNTTLYSNGTISGTPTSSGHYSFIVRLSDSQSPSVSVTKPFFLDIYNSSISITTASISNGTSGTAYSQQLYASGGNNSFVWSVISGSLPVGVSLTSSGLLSGIPADVGQFSFTAQVTDTQNSPPASHSYSFTITNGAMQQCADNPFNINSGASPNVCSLSTTNVISGVVDHDQELFTTKGGMQNIAISLFYKSLPAYNGSLGTGWSHSYDISLTLNADGSVILKNGNGDKRYYTKSGSTYISPAGDYSTLVKNGDNSYTISYRDGSKYNFDTVGKITSLIDRYNNTITFAYTGSDMTTITDSTGRFATIGYDQSTTPHRISTVTDPNYNVYNFSYQGSNLYRVTNPEATYLAGRGYWEYQYYADGTLNTKRDPNGNISQYSYYADKKMQTATDPNGRTRTLVYPTTTGTLRTSTLTEKDGGQWLYTYDSTAGVIKQKTDPNGKLTDFYYYTNGLVKAKTEPKDGATRLTTFYKYDAYGNITIETEPVDISVYSPAIDIDSVDVASLASKTPPIKAVRHYTYDTNITDNNANPYHYDRIASVADERGSTSRTASFAYAKDGYGEVVTATATPGNYVTITRKNANGSVRESVDANNKTTSFTYYADDSYNRADGIVGLLWYVTNPDSTSTSYLGYDNNGNVFRIYNNDNIGASTTSTIYQFDTLNRLIHQLKTPNTLPSSSTHFDYDFVGNLKSVNDAENRTTTYFYNYNRQVTKITDAKSNDTVFTYSGSELNGIDKLVAVYDANVAKNTPLTSQPHTGYQYNQLGRLTDETDPLGKKLHYTYYDNGLLKEKYDATNETPGTLLVTYTYNNRGQITDKTFTDSTGNEHYTYNDNGQLLTAANQNISYTYAYYTDGRLQSITDNSTPARQIYYDQYDNNGQRKQVTILKGAGADQRVVNYDYDSFNRPWHIISNAGTFTYGYDGYSRRQTVTYPNQLTANYGYDELSRLTSLTHKNGATPFATFNYTQFDNVDNRKAVSGNKSETYGYDELYRLTSVTATKSEAFTYDAAGNRLTGPGLSDTTYQSNAANQMTQGRKLTYGYDNRGNQTTKTVPGTADKTWTRTWDYNNRLTQEQKVKGTEVKTITYKYDPFGRRLEKKFVQTKNGVTETETSNYLYDNEDIAVEYFTTASGTEKTFVTHGHGIDEPLALERGGSYFYFHQDGLGSITHVTNSAKTVVQSYTYDAYGMATPSTSFRNSYQYAGYVWDWETGTYHVRNRTYDQMAGVFTSKDPIGMAGGVSLYQYVNGNVQNATDPLGLLTLYGGESASAYVQGGGNTTLGSGAFFSKDKTGVATGSWLTYGGAIGERNTAGAGAGAGPVIGFFTGTLADAFVGKSSNLTVDLLYAGITFSKNDKGLGISISFGGKGIGAGFYKNETNTIINKTPCK